MSDENSGAQGSDRSAHPGQLPRAREEDDVLVGFVVCGEHGVHAVDQADGVGMCSNALPRVKRVS